MVGHDFHAGGILGSDEDRRHGGAVHAVFALGIFKQGNAAGRFAKISGMSAFRLDIKSRAREKALGKRFLKGHVIAEEPFTSFERNAARHPSRCGERWIHKLELAVVLSDMEYAA